MTAAPLFPPGAAPFRDRADAGRQLAARLTDLAERRDLLVLDYALIEQMGVSEGYVAAEIARVLEPTGEETGQ